MARWWPEIALAHNSAGDWGVKLSSGELLAGDPSYDVINFVVALHQAAAAAHKLNTGEN